PATKAQCYLDFIPVFQKPLQLSQLDVVIAFIGSRPELHFLELGLFLLGLAGLLRLLALKDALAVIHDPRHRRLGVRRNLYQIQFILRGFRECFLDRQNADLFPFGVNDTYFTCRYRLIAAILLSGCDCETSSIDMALMRALRPVAIDAQLYQKSRANPAQGASFLAAARLHLGLCLGSEGRHRHRAEILARARAHRHGAGLALAITHHQHVGHARHGVLANLVADLLVAQIAFGAQPSGAQSMSDFLRIVSLRIGDVEHLRLYRRQPQRQGAGIVLEQDADEALHRTENRAVQHDRHPALAGLIDVACTEALRHGKVELHGAQLPHAIEAVAQREL